jgi:hypothetical protein
MLSRIIPALLVAAVSIAPATAQIRAGGAASAGMGISAGSPGMTSSVAGSGGIGLPGNGLPGLGRDFAGGSARFHRRHPGDGGAILLGYPDFYSDADFHDSGDVSQPQVIVVQAAAPAPPPAAPAPRESLLIEWQGDHFVRSTASARTAEGSETAPDYAEKSGVPGPATGRSVPAQKNAAQPPRELPPAVLVFRDGRREEVSEYTIMSGTIYSKADYWTTGSWTRKIQIADLDVPATLKLNQQRGLNFVLPSSSNEVIVRP